MKNFIDTKSDLGFKKVFGEKPHLLISLLNNLLPLPYPIVTLQYLSPEIIPDLHEGKNSIVDVRCTDNHGRHFIVEMQVGRQSGYLKRALMNTTKVYSRQLMKDAQFHSSQPVYSLNLLDHLFKPEHTDWYHHYAMTNRNDMEEFIDDIQIIMIELPKWRKIGKFDLNNPKDRWLMYFTNPHAFDRLTQEERAKYDEIYEALESVEAKNFSPERLYAYELYIDNIRQYVTTMESERQEGRKEGINEGLSISLQIIEALKSNQESLEEIALRFKTPIDLVITLKSMV
ncbi:MAG: hypothetical protein RLZZ172_1099 [Bacteroidota bacterium]|jgi:predicted transposase/invertase (TIGR01784 family)